MVTFIAKSFSSYSAQIKLPIAIKNVKSGGSVSTLDMTLATYSGN